MVYSVECGAEGLACPISGCIRKYTTRTAFKCHVDCEHGDQCSPSPLNKGEKRASSDDVESEMKGLKKVKSVTSKDLFQSMFIYPFSNLTTHIYRNQKSQTFPYH